MEKTSTITDDTFRPRSSPTKIMGTAGNPEQGSTWCGGKP